MKKGFYGWVCSVILVLSFCTGVLAYSGPVVTEQVSKKDKVQIVVVKKKEREKSGGGESSEKSRAGKQD
jgi:hypothetical protein